MFWVQKYYKNNTGTYADILDGISVLHNGSKSNMPNVPNKMEFKKSHDTAHMQGYQGMWSINWWAVRTEALTLQQWLHSLLAEG